MQIKLFPEFSRPEYEPVHNFDADSEPVVSLDQWFTDELRDLLITDTNRYARQANVNNWVDTTHEEMRCFIGFLFGTSINKKFKQLKTALFFNPFALRKTLDNI